MLSTEQDSSSGIRLVARVYRVTAFGLLACLAHTADYEQYQQQQHMQHATAEYGTVTGSAAALPCAARLSLSSSPPSPRFAFRFIRDGRVSQ